MKKLLPILALTLLTSAARADALDSRINALLANANDQLKSAAISIDIVELPAPQSAKKEATALFSRNPTMPLGPASNCKLLTTAAAFERYGPNASFKTTLFKIGDDLLLVGGGDPGLGDAKLNARGGKDANVSPTAVFEAWAAQLQQKGITSYRTLIVDDRIFDSQFTHPNWPADQTLMEYSAPIGGLNFNANCLDYIPKLTKTGVGLELIPMTSYVTVANKATRGKETRISLIRPATANTFTLRGTIASSGTTPSSVPIYDPGLWTGTILADTLASAGITSSAPKSTAVRRAGPDERFLNGTLLASHETPILAVITRANTNSLNMMAEGLCKRLGYDASGGKQAGSWATGTAAVEAYVKSLGAKADWLSLDDGSGLSNKNRAAARAFTTVLAHIAARPDADQFIATLAEPGAGSLRNRFKDTIGKQSGGVAEHVHAKTGHISGVSTLSGYLIMDPPSPNAPPRRFAFSLLFNKYQGNVNPLQDQIVQALYQWASGK